jgi:hypothetical protein
MDDDIDVFLAFTSKARIGHGLFDLFIFCYGHVWSLGRPFYLFIEQRHDSPIIRNFPSYGRFFILIYLFL